MWELIKYADHAHFVLSSVPWFIRNAVNLRKIWYNN